MVKRLLHKIGVVRKHQIILEVPKEQFVQELKKITFEGFRDDAKTTIKYTGYVTPYNFKLRDHILRGGSKRDPSAALGKFKSSGQGHQLDLRIDGGHGNFILYFIASSAFFGLLIMVIMTGSNLSGLTLQKATIGLAIWLVISVVRLLYIRMMVVGLEASVLIEINKINKGKE